LLKAGWAAFKAGLLAKILARAETALKWLAFPSPESPA
jgi:hypothetical protein